MDMAAIPVAVRSKKLCSTALHADPAIPLLQLSSKSDSMFWNNTPFPSSSYFRKVFQKPPHAVRNVLYHHSPNSTFLVGRFEQQTPTAGTPAGWKRDAGGTRTWTRWESMWCTGEGRKLLEQCGKKESTEVKGIQVQMLTGGSAAPFAGWSQTCGSHLALLRLWAAATWWCG